MSAPLPKKYCSIWRPGIPAPWPETIGQKCLVYLGALGDLNLHPELWHRTCVRDSSPSSDRTIVACGERLEIFQRIGGEDTQSLNQLIAAVLIATAGAAALPSSALAAADEPPAQRGSGFAPDFYSRELDQYRDYIARMTPENRAKLMAMQDKLMQMEMDHKSAMMKMEMEMAKARRDMEFFILNSGYPFQNSNR